MSLRVAKQIEQARRVGEDDGSGGSGRAPVLITR